MSDASAIVELIRRVENSLVDRIIMLEIRLSEIGIDAALTEARALVTEAQSALDECRALVAVASVRESRAENAAENAAESIAAAIEEAIAETTDDTVETISDKIVDTLPPELIGESSDVPPERTPFLERPLFGNKR